MNRKHNVSGIGFWGLDSIPKLFVVVARIARSSLEVSNTIFCLNYTLENLSISLVVIYGNEKSWKETRNATDSSILTLL